MHGFSSISDWIAFDNKAVGIILLAGLNFHELDFASGQALYKVILFEIFLV